MNDRRDLWNKVRSLLEERVVDPLTIALVKEKFYPSILGLPRPRVNGTFRASVLPYLTLRKAINRTEYYKLTYTTDIVIRDDREYRVISQLPCNEEGDRVQVLLITPVGQDTLVLKRELFENGWDVFFTTHQDFEYHKVSDLKVETLNPEKPPTERAIMFEHHYDIGLYRKSHLYLPKGQHHGR